MTTTKRITYNRGNLASTIGAAQRIAKADGKPRYVLATYLGWTITTEAPTTQSHYACNGTTMTRRDYQPWTAEKWAATPVCCQ